MTDVHDVLQWMFEMVVNHLEKMEKHPRPIRRMEADEKGLDLFTKSGLRFRVTVTPFPFPDEARDGFVKSENRRDDVISLSASDWETLVEACRSVLRFLESLPGKSEKGA